MNSSVQLLDNDLLEDKEKLEIIDHWLNVMNRPQGWHYDLDIIWLLQQLNNSGIKKGATLLDAGAGYGVMQFILASLGYNVVSLDFSERVYPKLARGIFDIDILSQKEINYDHEYMSFVKYDQSNKRKKEDYEISIKTRLVLLKNHLADKITSFYKTLDNLEEKRKDHSAFGKIKFLRGAFHQIPLKEDSVDAIISVSALEHADYGLLQENLSEFRRVVKADGPILITTSATNEKENAYHEKTKGICFSQKAIASFSEKMVIKNFNYDQIETNLLSSKLFISRLDNYYVKDPLSEFYRKEVNKLPYLSVGIKI